MGRILFHVLTIATTVVVNINPVLRDDRSPVAVITGVMAAAITVADLLDV